MRFYICSGLVEWPRARKAICYLTEQGHRCTYDWTKLAETANADDNGSPVPLRQIAIQEKRAVLQADAVLILTSNDRTIGCGMWVEFGMALASPHLPWIGLSGGQMLRNVFCHLANATTDDDATLLELCLEHFESRMQVGVGR